MRYLLYVIGVGVLISLAFTAVTEVQPGEVGVVRRFGRMLETTVEPGLHIGLPWGMDRVDRVPIGRVRKVAVGHTPGDINEASTSTPPGRLLSGDHNLVNVQVEIYYAVDKNKVGHYVLQSDRVDTLVARLTETALAEWVAGRSVDDVLLRGKITLPAWLIQTLPQRLKAYNLGIILEDATVTHLFPPEEVKDFFDNVARVHTEIRTKRNQAEQEADTRQREAAAEKYQSQRRSAAYAHEQQLAAQAEAGNFEKRLEQYQRLRQENPHYLAGIWWDEMSRLFTRMRANGRIDVLDHHLNGEGLNITHMPLLPKKK